MDSNLWFLVERPSNRSWETGLLARKRERICWGTGSSNPFPSSAESCANPSSSERGNVAAEEVARKHAILEPVNRLAVALARIMSTSKLVNGLDKC